MMRRRTERGAKAGSGERGFTLLELMVVVIIVGLIAALAVPSMRIATYDRHAYEDAGAVTQLFRDARLRSVARGSAILVTMTANGTADRGTFNVYEAVAQDPADPSHAFQMPVPTCKAPTSPWSLPPAQTTLFVEGVDLKGPQEVDADIETQIFTYSGAVGAAAPAATPQTAMYICYTPIGRSFFTTATPINFNGLPASTSVTEVRVSRGLSNGLIGATVRSVIVEPNGMPRILTKIL
jgi:prepilin-type N-terminal cleavage/methylation domain-containing protein